MKVIEDIGKDHLLIEVTRKEFTDLKMEKLSMEDDDNEDEDEDEESHSIQRRVGGAKVIQYIKKPCVAVLMTEPQLEKLKKAALFRIID